MSERIATTEPEMIPAADEPEEDSRRRQAAGEAPPGGAQAAPGIGWAGSGGEARWSWPPCWAVARAVPIW